MAVGLLKDALGSKSDIEVQSAGVLGFNGIRASANSIEVLEEEGIDISEHRSQQLTKEVVNEADLILVMTQIHKLEVINFLEKPGKEVYLIKEFAPREEQGEMNISDPIGRSIFVYRSCRDELKQCMPQLVKKILEKT